MKYIFVTGAPGSKWSSVVKSIYYSSSIDTSDSDNSREYHRPINYKLQLMHMGVYWGPGMEFGEWFDKLSEYDKNKNEIEFDNPFSGTGIKIIKSHVFAHHIDYIKKTWSDCPMILVDRDNDECLEWWVKCGGFEIKYPSYTSYYQNIELMKHHIELENQATRNALKIYNNTKVETSYKLAEVLGISTSPTEFAQVYKDLGADVYII